MKAAAGLLDTHGPAPADGAARDAGVDGLRGLAAVAVLGYHVATTAGGPISAWIAPLGDFAVAVFFALSGYLLWRPVARSVLGGRAGPGPGGFFLRRAARILPAYWAAITIGFWLLRSGRPHSIGEALAQYTLTHVYRQGDPAAGLLVAWTLAAEVTFYGLVAILAIGLAGLPRSLPIANRSRLLAGLAVALVLAGVASRQLVFSGGAGGAWRRQWSPNLVDWFAFGMLLGVARARSDVGLAVPRAVRAALRFPWLWWALAVELYWVMTRIAASFADGRPVTTGRLQAIYLLVGVTAAVVLAPIVLGDHRRGPAVALRTAPMAFLGQISYGVYLWHAVWLRVIDRWSASGAIPHAYLPRLGVTLALTLPSAWLSWIFVERPCIAWARARTATPAAPSRLA